MNRAESDRHSLKHAKFIHIDPKQGDIRVDHMSPVVVMKKIKLGPSDASGFASVTDFLPELTDAAAETQETESQVVARRDAEEGGAGAVHHEEVSFIHSMTEEERNLHVQQCLEMSSENRINAKNAFALQLIDCFSFLQEKKDFSAMACTLDAGAKIYSCRVDSLHQQVKKLADEFAVRQQKRTTGDKGDTDGGGDTPAGGRLTKELRKGRKNKFIASAESLTRKMKAKDPRDQYLRFEGLPGAILSGARRDPTDLSLSLERYLPFWPNWETYKPLKAEGMVPLPEIKIIRERPETATSDSPRTSEPDRRHSFDDGDDANNIFEDTPCSEEFVSIVDLPVIDQSSGDAGDDARVSDEAEEHASSGAGGVVDDGEVGVVATAMARLREEAEREGAVNKAPSRTQALEILFDLKSEYDYLNVRNRHYWTGPEFWKRPKMQTEYGTENRKVPSKKKKDPKEIVYDFENQSEMLVKLSKKATYLSERTVASWKKKKTILPANLKDGLTSFFNLFHVETCGKLDESGLEQKPTSFVNVSECLENVEDITDETTDPFGLDHQDSSGDQDPLNATFYEAASGRSADSTEPSNPLDSTFYDPGPGPSNRELGKIIRVEVSSSATSDYESSMVPVPKMVNVIPIKYSTRPIRVDMQHLKRAMLEVIREEVEKDAGQKRRTGGEGTSARPGVTFRDVLRRLPQKLETRTREDLSIAIAFTAVLSLANENSLQLQKCETSGDFVVRFPDFPDPVSGDDSDAESCFKRPMAK